MPSTKGCPMDAPSALALIVLALVALDLAALRFGHDSRDLDGRRRDWW